MADVDNIVLEHVRCIRDAVDGLREDVCDVKQCLGALEREVAQVHVNVEKLSERIDRLSVRMERMEFRFDRPEA